MLLRVSSKVVELVLQFDDRFLEIELMSHALGRLNVFYRSINRIPKHVPGSIVIATLIHPPKIESGIEIRAVKKRKAGLSSGLR